MNDLKEWCQGEEALFKEHPQPKLDVTTTPEVDEYIPDFLGKKLPKEYNGQLSG